MLAVPMLALRTTAALAGFMASVVGARVEMPLVGPALVAIMLVAHTATLSDPLREFRPVLVIGVLGTLAESAWIAAGAYAPLDAMRGSVLCPLWITALWLNAAVFVQGLPLAGGAKSYCFAAIAGAAALPAAYAVTAALGGILVAWRPAPALAAASAYGAAMAPLAVWLTRSRRPRLTRLATSRPA